MSKCQEKYDLNEKTCKFYTKCPEGKVRNENFRCVKAPANPQNTIKRRIQKSKNDAEERLRGRTEMLKNLFKSRTNQFLKIDDDNIKEKLMRIKTQTVKRGFDDITENVNALLERVQAYNVKKPRTRTRKPKKSIQSNSNSRMSPNSRMNTNSRKYRMTKEVNLDDLDLNGVEDLRASYNSPKPSPENTQVNTPELETVLEEPNHENSETQNRYAKAVSGMFNSMNMDKLNLMLGKKPKTLRQRRVPKGTSMNAKPRRRRTTKNNTSL